MKLTNEEVSEGCLFEASCSALKRLQAENECLREQCDCCHHPVERYSLEQDRDALLSERSAVRAAAIDEFMEKLFPRCVETTAKYSVEQIREIAAGLKEGK